MGRTNVAPASTPSISNSLERWPQRLWNVPPIADNTESRAVEPVPNCAATGQDSNGRLKRFQLANVIAAPTKIVFRVAHQKRSNTRCTFTADHLPFPDAGESTGAI